VSRLCRSRNRVNGAQTFRRTSSTTATSNSTSQTLSQNRDSASSSSTVPNNNGAGVYIPPHMNAANSNSTSRTGAADARYSKEQLLSIQQNMIQSSTLDNNLSHIFQGTWDPRDNTLGSRSQPAGADSKDQAPGPEVCWNARPNSRPFGLTSMTEEEKQV
jgi:hypothetical protein